MSERLLRHGASSRLNHPNLTDISQAADRPPHRPLSPTPSLSSILFSVVSLSLSHPLTAATYSRALTLRRPTISASSACLPACPACGACFPIPHSIFLVVARTPREKVTSQSRVSQDPANPSWYKIVPSGSQQRRCHHRRRSRRNAPERLTSRNWDSVRRRSDIIDCGGYPWLMDIAGLCAATRDVRLMHFASLNLIVRSIEHVGEKQKTRLLLV